MSELGGQIDTTIKEEILECFENVIKSLCEDSDEKISEEKRDNTGDCKTKDGDHEETVKCLECKFLYTTPQSMKLHQIVHCTSPPYQCPLCVYKAYTSNQHNCHVITHTQDKPHSCSICNQRFHRSQELKKHVNRFHGEGYNIRTDKAYFLNEHPKPKRIKTECKRPDTVNISKDHKVGDESDGEVTGCTKCKFLFTKPLSLQLHQHVHTSKPPYQCTLCERTTTTAGDFNQHIYTHTKDRPYACSHCAVRCQRADDVLNHRDKYHPECVIKCDECSHRASSTDLLAQHVAMAHAGLSDGRVVMQCEQCTFVYTKPQSLDLHLVIHSCRAPYQCPRCEYSTSTNSQFNNHIFKHTKDRPYCCSHCSACFTQKVNLKTHVTSKHPAALLRCEQCNITFGSRAVLNKHLTRTKAHSGIMGGNVLKCEQCAFVYTKVESLDVHLEIVHGTKRPFACPKCDYTTKFGPSFNNHILTHTRDKPYRCKHCDNTFTTYGCLAKHDSAHHHQDHLKNKEEQLYSVQID